MTNFKDFLFRTPSAKYIKTFSITFIILIGILVVIGLTTSPNTTLKIPGEVERPFWPKYIEEDDTETDRRVVEPKNEGPNSDRMVFDKWSFTHITHGVIFFCVLTSLNKLLNIKLNVWALFLITLVGEIIWEHIENSKEVVNKLRSGGFTSSGDSIVNSIGDIISCLSGFLLTSISPLLALCYVIVSEILLYPRSLSGLLINTF
tara:strand:- start:2319 stop:2930 length:612 start_codon:yes stop_codon:yes gene_type:complete